MAVTKVTLSGEQKQPIRSVDLFLIISATESYFMCV